MIALFVIIEGYVAKYNIDSLIRQRRERNMIFKIIGGISLVVLVVVTNILNVVKKSKIRKRQDAAYAILKEEALDYSLKHAVSEKFRMDKRVMLQLFSKKLGIDSVFDPEKKITFGRANDNTIVLNSPTVSSYHCEIFAKNGTVFIKDLNSSNGTIVQHKVKKQSLKEGDMKELYTKDKIIISGISMEVILFYIDKSYFNKNS